MEECAGPCTRPWPASSRTVSSKARMRWSWPSMVASSAGSAAFQSAAVLDRPAHSALGDRRLTRGMGATLPRDCIHFNRKRRPFGRKVVEFDLIGYNLGLEEPPMTTGGIPGLRGGDHVGITVPDLAQAHEFLVDVLGCRPVYSLPSMRHDDDWMLDHLNVDPSRVVNEIRFYRCGNGLNFEVFEYEPHEGQREAPRNSDIGGHHIAFYVDDMDAAVEYLRARGVRLLAGPVASKNASAGQRWQYFLAPWGMQFELVSYPGGKAYEDGAPVLLWHP